MRRGLVPVIAVLSLAQPLAADALELADGRVLVGAVTQHGELLRVHTRTGVVEIAAADVVARRTDEQLRTELRERAKQAGGSAFDELKLAGAALGYGLEREMWKHLDRCLERLAERESKAVSRELSRFLATLEPEVLPATDRPQDTEHRVRALLRTVRGQVGPAWRAAVVELLVAEPDADLALRFATRRQPLPEHRLIALHACARRGAGSEPELYRAMVVDREQEVRQGAADLVRAHGNPEHAVRSLAPGFLHDDPNVRGRTAQALANLGDLAGAPYLVAAGPVAGQTRAMLASGGKLGVRGAMFQIEQRAYIEDFEVEIAQAAAVANPIIGRVGQGVVLDVNVPAVITMASRTVDTYRRALQRITGEDPGGDPSTWDAWWLARKPAAVPREQGQGR